MWAKIEHGAQIPIPHPVGVKQDWIDELFHLTICIRFANPFSLALDNIQNRFQIKFYVDVIGVLTVMWRVTTALTGKKIGPWHNWVNMEQTGRDKPNNKKLQEDGRANFFPARIKAREFCKQIQLKPKLRSTPFYSSTWGRVGWVWSFAF